MSRFAGFLNPIDRDRWKGSVFGTDRAPAGRDHTSWVEDVMTSDTKRIAVYSTLVTFLILAWAYIPA